MIHPQPKPEPRARTKGREKRQKAKTHAEIRQYVFARERDICRICRCRPAESMHELLFRSLGGKVSKRNSVAVCGSGTTGCHGFAQRNEISYEPTYEMAEATMKFNARTKPAADWLKIRRWQWIESPVMQEVEAAE